MSKVLEKARYLAMIGIFALLVASLAAFGWGTLKTATTVWLIVESLGKAAAITVELIEIVDSFLIATALLIFAVGLYELFIGDLDLPEWMVAHNLHDLKAKLSSMMVLVMGVKFLGKLVEVKNYTELLQFGAAVALVSAVLIAFGHFGHKD
jgi:uncharacterized membrane protein YqhA